MTSKTLKEKDTIIDERIEQGLNRIDKMEEVIDKVGSAFTPPKANTSASRNKNTKFIYIPKSVSTPPTQRNEDLKMISVHPNFISFTKHLYSSYLLLGNMVVWLRSLRPKMTTLDTMHYA